MSIKNPSLEKIIPEFGSSFSVKQYISPTLNSKTPFWHFHSELELVYIKGGKGKRHIGNHLSYYDEGDLILMGSNLPHYGFTSPASGNISETIVQIKNHFLGENFFYLPEMLSISQMFERSKSGIVFHGNTKSSVGAKLEALPQLEYFERLLELLKILKELALSNEFKILNASGFKLEVPHQDNERINDVYYYVRQHFQEPIKLEEIAKEVSMTVPAFCRFFKKISGKTFTQFVNELRVVHATKLLTEEKTSITEICMESGFNNFSHFNKVFKGTTGKSPSDYRKETSQFFT